jgi:hypothetical protein
VSGALSENGQRRGYSDGSGGVAAATTCTLQVKAIFRDVDEQHAQALAAEMIARAHELANQPECQCDVDVSVQSAAPVAPIDEC